MIKRLILINVGSDIQKEFQRLGIDYLGKNGLEVEVWDITRILFRGINIKLPDSTDYPGIRLFDSKRKVISALSTLAENDFVFPNTFSWQDKLWLFRGISKYGLKYGLCSLAAIPSQGPPNSAVEKKKSVTLRLKKLMTMRISELKSYLPYLKRSLMLWNPTKHLGINPLDIWFASGSMCPAVYNYPVGKDSKIIWQNSYDYDVYLKHRDIEIREKPDLAVFLDQNLPFHPNFKMFKLPNLMNKEKYYASLCRFFNYLEDIQGVKIEIACHPTANYEEGTKYYGNRPMHKGKTIELIRQAKFIILHHSTAVNFAVLFNKPVIFIINDEVVKIGRTHIVNVMAEWLGKKVINIDEAFLIDWERELSIDQARYREYKDAFIKKDGSAELFSWQILADTLKNYKRTVK